MVNAARASAPRAASPPSPNQSLAKHNRNPVQLAENKHQRPKSIASFCRSLAPCAPPHQLRLTTHRFLIASRQLLENELTRLQQTRKHFLIASFSGISEFAPSSANHSSPIAPILFDTNERTRENLPRSQQTRKRFLIDTFERYSTQPLHFEFHESPVATVELPPYD
jgi:hypothetical protein